MLREDQAQLAVFVVLGRHHDGCKMGDITMPVQPVAGTGFCLARNGCCSMMAVWRMGGVTLSWRR